MGYYKVVRKTTKDDVYASCFMSGKARVEYKVGELATPPAFLAEKGYGLTVFDNFDSAKKFAGGSPNQSIFRVGVLSPVRAPLPMLDSYSLARGYFVGIGIGNNKFPNGTVFVDGVILMEEVKRAKASWKSPCG